MAKTADVVRFFTAKHDLYDRFIQWVGYPQGLRTFLEQSHLLRSDLRSARGAALQARQRWASPSLHHKTQLAHTTTSRLVVAVESL
jgi:hypothetical protein